MKSIIISFIKYGVLFILVISFLMLIGIGLITWKQPQTVQNILTYLMPSPTHVPIQIKGIAVLGDSQSDEYRADDYRGGSFASTTLNWVELLAQKRKLNFGKWGIREEPRREGYEYNFARSSETAASALEKGQHTGIAKMVKEGKVNTVVIFIGANDFLPYLTEDGYKTIYDGTVTDAQILQKVNRITADITTAVDVIREAGTVHIILVKIPDWGDHIGVQVAFPFPDQRERVTKVVEMQNAKLQEIADARNMKTIDPNKLYSDFLASKMMVGDTKMKLFLLNNDPINIFLDDGIHPGTVMSGLFANEVIKTLNSMGVKIRPFTEKEILENAGIYSKGN